MKTKTKSLSLLAIVAMLTIAASLLIAPISARDLNIADNQNIIYYSGGEAYVTIPMSMLNPGTPHLSDGVTVIPVSTIPTTATLDITMTSTVDGSDGPGTSIGISVPWTVAGVVYYLPNAYFANVPGSVITFIQTLLKGYPAAVSTNTRYSDDVMVERHGNAITAQLTESQTFVYAYQTMYNGKTVAAGVPVTIPSFTIELSKVGGDVQRESSTKLASGYIQDVHKIGFNAEGTITFVDLEPKQLSNCFITMHGNTLWTAPPPKA